MRKRPKKRNDRSKIKPPESVDIFSEKYGVKGRVQSDGITEMLSFEYGGRRHELLLSRTLTDDFPKYWLEIMEKNLEYHSAPEKAPRLYNWTIRIHRAHGAVVGHPHIADSPYVTTTEIRGIEIDDELGVAVITTDNTVYRAGLKDCNFGLQREYAAELPRYEELREKYYQGEEE